MSDNYVAWCRFSNKSIVTCDSDAEGAFKVYRFWKPDNYVPTMDEAGRFIKINPITTAEMLKDLVVEVEKKSNEEEKGRIMTHATERQIIAALVTKLSHGFEADLFSRLRAYAAVVEAADEVAVAYATSQLGCHEVAISAARQVALVDAMTELVEALAAITWKKEKP